MLFQILVPAIVGGALGMFEQEIANGLGGRGIRISQHEVEDDAAE